MCFFRVLNPCYTLLYNANDIGTSRLAMSNYACAVCSTLSIAEVTVISSIKTEGVRNNDDDKKLLPERLTERLCNYISSRCHLEEMTISNSHAPWVAFKLSSWRNETRESRHRLNTQETTKTNSFTSWKNVLE